MDVRDLEDTICYLCRDPLPSRNQASPSPPTLSPVPPPPTPPTNRRPNVQPSPPTRATSFSHNSTRCQCLWRSHGNQQRPQRLRCVNSRRCRYNCYRFPRNLGRWIRYSSSFSEIVKIRFRLIRTDMSILITYGNAETVDSSMQEEARID